MRLCCQHARGEGRAGPALAVAMRRIDDHSPGWLAAIAVLSLIGCQPSGSAGGGPFASGGGGTTAEDASGAAIGDANESGEVMDADDGADADDAADADDGADADDAADADDGADTNGAADAGDAADDAAAPNDAADTAVAYDPNQPPGPIPALDAEPAPACAAALAKDDYFQFLDDLCDAKVQPSHVDAAQACPVVDLAAIVPLKGGGSASYVPYDAPLVPQTQALDGLLPAGMAMSVLLVKRIADTPHLRLLATTDHNKAVQPWSSTKWLAAANAAATLRASSGYKVGLTGSAKGYAIGDLISSMHRYDDAPYSSNGLGRWFHDIGGRAKANALIHDAWLGRPADETFGGNYGEASPPLGYSFVEADGATLTLSPDLTSGPANHLSPLTLALALQRVVLHREQPTTRLPGLQWQDIEVLLYGAPASQNYGPFGGMSADTAIYVQAGLDMGFIEQRSAGRWRIHSKLGLGTAFQFVWVGYACLPWLDAAGAPIPGWGREVVIALHLPTGGKDWRERDRLVAKGVRAVLARVVDGRL